MPKSDTIPGLAVPPLRTRVLERRPRYLLTAQSTNDLALDCRKDGAIFVADAQTAGRGRHGNAWHSAPGLGLWFSVALKGSSRGLMFAASLAVREAVQPRAELALKWPNDLLCAGRKVCGILVEHREAWSAVGVGINVHHRPEDFPEALRKSAGSLDSTTGLPWARSGLLHAVLEALDAAVWRLRHGGHDALWREWSEACDMVGRRVHRNGWWGRVVAVDEDGALLVERKDGRQERITGEVDTLAQ